MSKKLTGKVAVVTGASKGIGSAIAIYLAAEGASVVVNYATSKEGADRVVAEIAKNGGKAVAVQADMSKKDSIKSLFLATTKAFGAIDILVNNAGIYTPAPLEDITEENFHKQVDLNVLGLLLSTQEAVKHFNPAGGSIVNVSSVVSTLGFGGHVGVLLHQSCSRRHYPLLGKRTGTAQDPGQFGESWHVETEGLHSTGIMQQSEGMAAMTPLGRIGQPEDIAPAVVFFASGDSSWITGETLYITGGFR